MPVRRLLAIYGLARGNLAVHTALSLFGGLVLAALSWSGLVKRVLKLTNFKSGFLGGTPEPTDADQLRRPDGIRAATMVIPMPPEIRPSDVRAGDVQAGDGQARNGQARNGRAGRARAGGARAAEGRAAEGRAAAPVETTALIGARRPAKRRRSAAAQRDREPVDETMVLLPPDESEETLLLRPRGAVDDTLYLGRRDRY
jgi:hypothetical protein